MTFLQRSTHSPNYVYNEGMEDKTAESKVLNTDGETSAFNDIDYVVMIPPSSKSRVKDAAKQAGVKFILLQSVLGVDDGFAYTRAYRQMETCVVDSGIRFAFLRPAWFLENLFMQKSSIQNDSCIRLPLGGGKIVPLSVEDFVAFAKEVLRAPERHVIKRWSEKLANRGNSGAIWYGHVSSWKILLLMVVFKPELMAANRFSTLAGLEEFQKRTGEKGITTRAFFEKNKSYFTPTVDLEDTARAAEPVLERSDERTFHSATEVSSQPVVQKESVQKETEVQTPQRQIIPPRQRMTAETTMLEDTLQEIIDEEETVTRERRATLQKAEE
ncbi:hypothetical protein M427DRAFT_502924 [Gonapodya prolifera JEL478]|uniref:NAD(P)-binding domain-containing protein n=1 Tax=Gonapodya prolifera (strain JEL478) TaxID=1344416 RepID=A0A139ATR9_GONPJ|nr:hypothetical protein M427DRAFT_502924 [Gonapodya prolifera JEL478]|eukprot:KXS20126.1 hypothetical protein M427DRAFT_502924 [Gonapodya prolifera JEL478]